MLVYRVEHPEYTARRGELWSFPPGPYWHGHVDAAGEVCDRMDREHSFTPARPAWLRAGICYSAMGCALSACVSLNDLRAWFDGFVLDLHSAGFRVGVYDAMNVQESQHGLPQAVFDYATASLVDTMSLIGDEER